MVNFAPSWTRSIIFDALYAGCGASFWIKSYYRDGKRRATHGSVLHGDIIIFDSFPSLPDSWQSRKPTREVLRAHHHRLYFPQLWSLYA